MSINPRSVVASKSLVKCGKSLDRSPTSSPSTTEPIFTELLQRDEQTPFLKNLVTGDESWLLFKNVRRKKVCVSPGVSPKGISKHVHCKKAMWRVCWDRNARGIDRLPSKWEAIIEVDSDYAPE
ncbi:histone-lysine N-methyltransferase SETMAR [Trichonephila inaurata madagascariensis]|uniref:Histone-lysine N-methyltransferase SETMAR n=1 Tax=Trichonephila inaurata madagascariensis TaxID=2747483 RepID=A0A8X6MAS7_9ARAC|nr:histone-lysine N-methyltransferase SETMAR [Trichonephila inaurata madagascariensis]